MKKYKIISSIFSKINKLTYTCNLCGKEIFDGNYFCEKCLKNELYRENYPICECCGRKVPNVMERCVSCKDGWAVDFARSVYEYKGGIEKLIKRFKYNNAQYLSEIFTNYLEDLYIKNNFSADIITFVPMTLDKLFERGFNHSELLAKSLADRLDLECVEVLEKVKETKNQANLSSEERHKNLLGSFKIINSNILKNKCVLITDDVLTTGATSDVMAKLIKKAGAKRVELITLASVQKAINSNILTKIAIN